MIDHIREKVEAEMQRVIKCREMYREHSRAHPPTQGAHDEAERLGHLAEFNEVIMLCQQALQNNSGDLMLKALALAGRTP